jgi:hypothetical protein
MDPDFGQTSLTMPATLLQIERELKLPAFKLVAREGLRFANVSTTDGESGLAEVALMYVAETASDEDGSPVSNQMATGLPAAYREWLVLRSRPVLADPVLTVLRPEESSSALEEAVRRESDRSTRHSGAESSVKMPEVASTRSAVPAAAIEIEVDGVRHEAIALTQGQHRAIGCSIDGRHLIAILDTEFFPLDELWFTTEPWTG